jgi:glyoxylase-like metal-dependent hydrolase (beta-lactamase superfamily II)
MRVDFLKVTDHIYRIELPVRILGPLTIPVAAFLVEDSEGWTLIDSGPTETGPDLVAAIHEITDGEGPRQVLLTHAHYDHSGGLGDVLLEWNPPLFSHREEARFITGQSDYRYVPSRNLLFLVARYLIPQTGWGYPVARALERGEAVAGMVVIQLPGHSPGQVGFLHPRDQAMICGDAIMNIGGHLSFPYRFLSSDLVLTQQSIQRLAELDYRHLLPSHGDPILEVGRQALLDYLGLALAPDPLDHWQE